jgi:toxin ParE1/3/4
MSSVKIRPLAWQDISETAEYLEQHAGLAVAERFLSAVSSELNSLAKMPQIGHLCGFENEEASGIRRWPVSNFERWLIFYQATDSGIEIARVLHGAQDIQAIFD